MTQKQFDKAEEILKNLQKSGNKFDVDEAYWILTDVYLEQGLYEKTIAALEEKNQQRGRGVSNRRSAAAR
ncbi:hypothetical protein FK545_14855 [Planococcus glaciei]|nr:hypothetical protein FK545_14855 [Planococcus glaciei]